MSQAAPDPRRRASRSGRLLSLALLGATLLLSPCWGPVLYHARVYPKVIRTAQDAQGRRAELLVTLPPLSLYAFSNIGLALRVTAADGRELLWRQLERNWMYDLEEDIEIEELILSEDVVIVRKSDYTREFRFPIPRPQ